MTRTLMTRWRTSDPPPPMGDPGSATVKNDRGDAMNGTPRKGASAMTLRSSLGHLCSLMHVITPGTYVEDACDPLSAAYVRLRSHDDDTPARRRIPAGHERLLGSGLRKLTDSG